MILRTQYPTNETNKEVILTSSIAGVLLYLFLTIYQPFGTSEFEHAYKYLLLFPYAIFTGFSFYCVNLLLSTYKRNWVVGLELLKIFLILLLSSSFSYFYNTLFLSKVNLSFENYLYMFSYTLALGLPISVIYILTRYIYLNNRNKSLKTAIISNKEDNLEHRLFIVSDYSNDSLEIREEDFVFAESADNYCVLYFYHNGNLQKKTIRVSLTKLLSQIKTDTIQKVHRSFIVNLTRVTKYKGNTSGYKVSFDDIDKELIISRNYVDNALPVLKTLAFHP